LSREEVEEIRLRSLSILSRVGVWVEHVEALKMLRDIGAEVGLRQENCQDPRAHC
jgi:trimethylamine:corrinoid methyltransferase-like protein